jgi:prevent-host-death family protein
MEDAMIQIKPVSELRNNFPSIEKIVNNGTPVYLTKNGYGIMVVLSLEQYAELTDDVELRLDEADRVAALSQERLTHEEVFAKYRR